MDILKHASPHFHKGPTWAKGNSSVHFRACLILAGHNGEGYIETIGIYKDGSFVFTVQDLSQNIPDISASILPWWYHLRARVCTLLFNQYQVPAHTSLELVAFPVLPLCVHEHAVLPLYGVLCPDWIKWAGIPENVFSLLFSFFYFTLHNMDDCWNTELFNTQFNKKIMLTAALMSLAACMKGIVT